MKKLIVLFALAFAFGMVNVAQATLYSYDFSSIAVEGQSFEGVTLDFMTLSSETGNLAYTGDYGGGLVADFNNGGTSNQYLSFSAPIDFFSLRAGDGAGDNDAFSLYVYAFGTNAFLGRYDTPVFGGANEPEWFTLNVNAANIGYVLFDPGNSGVLPGNTNGFGGVVVTDIAYNTTAPVPEPSTFLLFGAGLAGVAFLRRRTKL